MCSRGISILILLLLLQALVWAGATYNADLARTPAVPGLTAIGFTMLSALCMGLGGRRAGQGADRWSDRRTG